METEPISLRSLGQGRWTVQIKGSILVLRREGLLSVWSIWLPVETVVFEKGRALRGGRLICAFGSLLLTIGVLLTGWAVLSRFRDPRGDGAWEGILLSATMLAGLVVFLVLLIMFFVPVRTVRIRAIRQGCKGTDGNQSKAGFFAGLQKGLPPGQPSTSFEVQFWVPSRVRRRLDSLIESAGRQNQMIDSRVRNGAFRIVELNLTREGRRPLLLLAQCLGLVFLFATPGLTTERPILFLLCLIPMVWTAYRIAAAMKRPYELRKAHACCTQGQWTQAIELLDQLELRRPQAESSASLRIMALVGLERFDEAIRVAEAIGDGEWELRTEMRDLVRVHRRLHERLSDEPQGAD